MIVISAYIFYFKFNKIVILRSKIYNPFIPNNLFLHFMKKMSNRCHMLYHKKTVKLLIFLLLMFLAFLLVEILKGEDEIYIDANITEI